MGIRLVILAVSLLLVVPLSGQERLRVGLMPHLNINYKSRDNWRLNFKVESRQMLRERGPDGGENRAFRYRLTDLSVLLTRKTGLNNQLGGGYLVRFDEGELMHRTIQQFAIVRNYRIFRLAHRFVGDQSFGKGIATQWRFRYRIGVDLALAGESVDHEEFYLKLTNEYLNIFRDGKYDLEIRLVPTIGYVLEDRSKIELGLDVRYDGFLHGDARQSYWIKGGWFFSFGNS